MIGSGIGFRCGIHSGLSILEFEGISDSPNQGCGTLYIILRIRQKVSDPAPIYGFVLRIRIRIPHIGTKIKTDPCGPGSVMPSQTICFGLPNFLMHVLNGYVDWLLSGKMSHWSEKRCEVAGKEFLDWIERMCKWSERMLCRPERMLYWLWMGFLNKLRGTEVLIGQYWPALIGQYWRVDLGCGYIRYLCFDS